VYNNKKNRPKTLTCKERLRIASQIYTPENGLQILARMIAEAYLEEIDQANQTNEKQHESFEKSLHDS